MRKKFVSAGHIKFLSTITFISTYVILNSVLYTHFGRAYQVTLGSGGLVPSPHENNLLVCLTSWFSFAEMIPLPQFVNVPVYRALQVSVCSLNFTIPLITIGLADSFYFLNDSRMLLEFKKCRLNFSPGRVYISAILSTLVCSGWTWKTYGYPNTGISIIGFSVLIIYLFWFPFFSALTLSWSNSFKKIVTIFIILLVFLIGIVVAYDQYLLNNESAHAHLIGFVLFLLILLSPQIGKSLVKSHRLVG